METAILLFLGVLGLVFGSFLTSLTYQTEKSDFSWDKLWRRSKCPKCKHPLIWHDNIPLLSYVVLGGKCRACSKPISKRYPLIEVAGLVVFLFMAVGYIRGTFDIWALPYFLFLATGLLAIAIVDLEHQIIPDKIVIPLVAIHLLVFIIFSLSPILFVNLFWASIASVFFLALYFITGGRGMGLGDVKLAFLIGLIAGHYAWIAIFLSFVIGAVVGIILILLHHASFGKPIPFGPFLILGTFLVILAGEKIESMLLGGVI